MAHTPLIDVRPAHRMSIYGRFTVFHGTKDGGAVLKGESSLRTVNGFMIQTGKHRISVVFRRHH